MFGFDRGVVKDISIHAPRVGSDLRGSTGPGADGGISIHAPRVGSDATGGWHPPGPWLISIHAPRVGSDCPPATGTSGG